MHKVVPDLLELMDPLDLKEKGAATVNLAHQVLLEKMAGQEPQAALDYQEKEEALDRMVLVVLLATLVLKEREEALA